MSFIDDVKKRGIEQARANEEYARLRRMEELNRKNSLHATFLNNGGVSGYAAHAFEKMKNDFMKGSLQTKNYHTMFADRAYYVSKNHYIGYDHGHHEWICGNERIKEGGIATAEEMSQITQLFYNKCIQEGITVLWITECERDYKKVEKMTIVYSALDFEKIILSKKKYRYTNILPAYGSSWHNSKFGQIYFGVPVND